MPTTDDVTIKPPLLLQQVLSDIIPSAQLIQHCLPQLPSAFRIELWLIQSELPQTALSSSVIEKLWRAPPYWLFCWASGLAMAQWLLANPEYVRGKTVLDFGAGSGVMAIAAKLAGAKRVIACDIDSVSLLACQENASLNHVELEYLSDIHQLASLITGQSVDVLLAADVLYDMENRAFLDVFLQYADTVLLADSRVKQLAHPHYRKIGTAEATTHPDMDEAKEFRHVSFYQAL